MGLACAVVVQHRVSLAERAALRVLPAQPDRHPLGQEAGKRESLGVRPIDAVLERITASFELARQLGVRLEVLRPGVNRVV